MAASHARAATPIAARIIIVLVFMVISQVVFHRPRPYLSFMVHRISRLLATKLCARIFDLCRFDGGARFGTRHFADRHFDTLMKAGAEFGATLSARLSVSAVYRLQRIGRDLRGGVIVPPCGVAGVCGKVDRCCKPGIGEGHPLAINPHVGMIAGRAIEDGAAQRWTGRQWPLR
jgi:hypothetical protein